MKPALCVNVQTIGIIALLLFLCPASFCDTDISIDCDFPGGNIIVERIAGQDVYLHQDLRDTEGDWFYWYFRVRGAEGRTLRFHFTKSNVIGVLGPAVSLDRGATWSWLGKESFADQSFSYTFSQDASEVRFCLSIPYQEEDLRHFLKQYRNSPYLKTDTLCHTKKGRPIERIYLGRLDGNCDYRVLLTCRHHSCEMTASYTIKGIMEAILTENPAGAWLREHVEFLIIPFMDKDGVEDGDQGKNRKPRDHCRDYVGTSLYPSVKALREYAPQWSNGKLTFFLDFHNPYIRGNYNEWIYFVGGPNTTIWEQVEQFSKILEQTRTGPLLFEAKNNLPYGVSWNKDSNFTAGKSAARWASELPGIRFSSSIEIPYAEASGQVITADNLKAFGYDLVKALRVYLSKSGE